MEHLLLKASATPTTDQGQFTAIAAAYTVDRVNDRIVPGAFKSTIERWRMSGKLIPLHWNHEGDPKSIIGSIDPKTMAEIDEGLYVEGRLDLGQSDMADEAWRSMKANRMSLSFGYLVPEGGAKKAEDGVNDLLELDLFEVSIVPAPANADTRILSTKSADDLRESALAMAKAEIGGKVGLDFNAEAEIEHAKEAIWAREQFNEDEIAGIKGEILKAVWTAAYINDLPDSAFLYVEPGDKDSEGKTTPRSKRHFPYKDASGAVDLPHLRNAMARIPQSSLSQDVKDQTAAKAQRILDNSKKADVASQEPKAREADPLKKEAMSAVHSVLGAGVKPPAVVIQEPPPRPEMDPDELKRVSHDLIVQVLRG